MSIFDVGRICIKTAGRDAGRYAVVVEQLDNRYVIVDGGVRRRKVNIHHLEPTGTMLSLPKGASHEQVAKELEKLQLKVWKTTPKKAAPRPLRKKAGKGAQKLSEQPEQAQPALKASLKKEAVKETAEKERAETMKEGKTEEKPVTKGE